MNVEDSTPSSIPPKASIRRSSTISEDIFGSAYDHKVVKRFTGYLSPYRKLIIFSMLTVLLFSVTAVLLPLIVKYTIDSALVAGVENTKILTICVTLFFATIALNFVGNYLQELIIGRIGERVLIQLRRSMFEHLQRVSLSFMDKTQVGSMMSRLQGDVGALQEFLHTITVGVGDIILIIGVVVTLFFLDWRLALMMIGVVPALLLIRIVWLPFARKAFIRSRVTASIVSGSLAENINGIRAVQGLTLSLIHI